MLPLLLTHACFCIFERVVTFSFLFYRTSCFSLEEYQTAKSAFEAGSTFAPEDTRFTDWIKKCDKCIAGNLIFIIS